MKKIIAIVLTVIMVAMAFGVAAPAVLAQNNNDDGEPLTVTKELVDSWPDEVLADDDGLIEVGEKWYFSLNITVTNTHPTATITDIVVKDRLGADLTVEDYSDPGVGTVNWGTNPGNNDQPRLTWDGFNLAPLETATLSINASTDIDRGGNQRYTSTGVHDLNSGANAKGRLDGKRVSNSSDPVSVECVWDLIDDWAVVYTQVSPTPGGPWTHAMSIDAENPDGTFTGAGTYPVSTPYTWTYSVSGDVTGNDVSMTLTYNEASITMSLIGTVATDGNSMSGIATQSPGGNIYTWTATRV